MKKFKVKNTAAIKLRTFSDPRGHLAVAEIEKELPFMVKRIFLIHNTKSNAERAAHATIKQEEVLFCLHGSLKVMLDDGLNKQEVVLNDPTRGLHIGKSVWRTLSDFSPNCVLLALSNTKYMTDDHISDYNEYVRHMRNKNGK
jgi:dTDP-4-dehydrorhamnose 3,5-epimerase-like enzyme